jgi:AcrR family transcriptional regulator
MAKKPHGPDVHDAIVNAALHLAAERGWRSLALADIAALAEVPLADLVEHLPSKSAILDAYLRRVDRHMMATVPDQGETPRDRLFDVIMRRFDAMAADRAALRVILRQSTDDPWAVLCGGRRFLQSMALILETAGFSSSGLRGIARIHGIAAVYLYAFRKFLDDDSPDQARTMAALDKALRRAEDWSSVLLRRRTTPATAPAPSQK